MHTGKCCLCLEDKKLIKAHIIPKGLYNLEPAKEPTKLVSNKPNEYPKKAPVGVYDEGILCAQCDNKIGEWDSYAAVFFKQEFVEEKYMIDNGARLAYVVDSYDYKSLKLFYMSMLWRAGVSSHGFFEKVDLGSHEAKLRDLLIRGDPGSSEQFSVIVSKFDYDSSLVPQLNPQRSRYDGLNCYKIYFYGYMSILKVDSRKYFETLNPYVIKPNEKLVVLLRDYRTSKEFKIMKRLAEKVRFRT
ncbi:MAG TPA: hypothetical protein PLY88_04780 [Candidatus Omnitrophota bacterium]|nr:hypothetical protein [Candidatus Omnitrophota bacterium]